MTAKRWIRTQNFLCIWMVRILPSTSLSGFPHRLSHANRLCLRYGIAPFVELLLRLVWHQGLLKGWRGLSISSHRLLGEMMLQGLQVAGADGDDSFP